MKNREFKFRFWDIKNCKWEKNFGIYGDGVVGDFSECFHNSAGENGEYYVIQQHTGLKDANGKEIYEGDILKHDIGLGPIYYDVCWSETNGQWKITKDHGGNIGTWFDNYVLAGNIFENQELLK